MKEFTLDLKAVNNACKRIGEKHPEHHYTLSGSEPCHYTKNSKSVPKGVTDFMGCLIGQGLRVVNPELWSFLSDIEKKTKLGCVAYLVDPDALRLAHGVVLNVSNIRYLKSLVSAQMVQDEGKSWGEAANQLSF